MYIYMHNIYNVCVYTSAFFSIAAAPTHTSTFVFEPHLKVCIHMVCACMQTCVTDHTAPDG